MAKNIRLQVMMDAKTYANLELFARENNIPSKNDSQMVHNLLYFATRELSKVKLSFYILKGNLEEKNKYIEQIEHQLATRDEIIKELRNESEIKSHENKTKSGKKKSH